MRSATVAITLPSRCLRAFRLGVQNRSIQALSADGAQVSFCHIQAASVFACVGSPVDQRTAGRTRPRTSRTARLRLGTRCVQHRHHALIPRIARLEHVPQSAAPVPPSAALGHRDMPPPGQGFNLGEDLVVTIVNVLVLRALLRPQLGWSGLAHLADELLVGFVHAGYEGGVTERLAPHCACGEAAPRILGMRCAVLSSSCRLWYDSRATTMSSKSFDLHGTSGSLLVYVNLRCVVSPAHAFRWSD